MSWFPQLWTAHRASIPNHPNFNGGCFNLSPPVCLPPGSTLDLFCCGPRFGTPLATGPRWSSSLDSNAPQEPVARRPAAHCAVLHAQRHIETLLQGQRPMGRAWWIMMAVARLGKEIFWYVQFGEVDFNVDLCRYIVRYAVCVYTFFCT